jgi:hypothetical protein
MPKFAVFFSDGAGYGFEMVQALDSAHAVGNLADRLSCQWPALVNWSAAGMAWSENSGLGGPRLLSSG